MKINHIHKALIVISILLVCATVEAQWELENFPELEGFSAPDSLKSISLNEFGKLHSYYSPYWEVSTANAKIADVISLAALQQGVSKKDSTLVGWGYLYLGENINDMKLYRKALVFADESKASPLLGSIYSAFVSYYNLEGDNEKTLKYAILGHNSAKGTGSYVDIFNSSYLMHSINSRWGDKKEGVAGLISILEQIKSREFKNNVKLSNSIRKKFRQRLVYSIAVSSYEMGQIELSNQYLEVLYENALQENDKEYIDAYMALKGATLFREGKYTKALDYTNAYLYNSHPNEPYGISRSNIIRGLTLWEIDEKEEAMRSFHIADSIYQKNLHEYEELGEGYHKMISYYNEKGNAVKELEYVNKLLDFNEEITSNYLEIAPAIQRAYTIPKLLEDKEALIAKLDKSNTSKGILNTILLLISVVLVVIGAVFAHNNHRYRKRYDKLLKDFEEKRYPTLYKRSTAQKELKELDAAQINLISGGLEKFELDERFIDKEITLKVMAKEIGTNSSYLSKYINAVKGENYSHYIGNLRIAYAIDHLTRVPKWRTYTIEAIGNEVGFATARSFTTHFKRVTGLNVSYFLKRLIRQDEKTATITEAPIPQTE